MQLTPKLYVELYKVFKSAFAKEWPDGEAPETDPAIWTCEKEFMDKAGKPIVKSIVGYTFERNTKYFYLLHRQAVSGKVVGMRNDLTRKILVYVGCEGKSLKELFENFYKQYNIPSELISAQSKIDLKNNDKIKKYSSVVGIPASIPLMKGIGGKCRHYLPGTKWWLYFYGYEAPENRDYVHHDWKLLRLVLSFSDEGNANLNVKITNKPDKNHYNYRGATDFDESIDTVLSMKLYTEPGVARQLIINIHVATCAGDLFMGQYLNYEEAGYIISGTVIMEKINLVKFPNPLPHVFSISRDAKKPEDYPEEVREIAPLLQSRVLNFRRTPISVHSKSDIKDWQNRRGE